MADADEVTVYVVRWAECWHHKPRWRGAIGFTPLPAGGVLKAFADPTAAEAFRADAERDARRGGPAVNPFAYSETSDPAQCLEFHHLGLAGFTSLPEPILRDWLQDAALDPPPTDDGFAAVMKWGWWWQRAEFTAEQRAKAWEAFDKVRLFEVVKVPPDRPPDDDAPDRPGFLPGWSSDPDDPIDEDMQLPWDDPPGDHGEDDDGIPF